MTRWMKKAQHYARLNQVSLPRLGRRDVLTINAGNKREIARQLVEMFQNGGKNPDAYNFKGLNLSGADLRGLNLRVLGAKALRSINFAGANLTGQNFRGMNLRGFYAPGAVLTDVKFDNANLENATLEKSKGGRVSFFGAYAVGINLNYATLTGCNWEGHFRGAKLAAAKITYGYFGEGSNFENARMRGTDLTGAIHTRGEPNFRGAEMQETLVRGDFRNANFAGANMTEAKLDGGKFSNAVFADTTMTAAHTGRIPNKYAALKLVETPMPMAPAPSFYRRKPLLQLAA